MTNYSRLLVWQKADELALQIYRHTENFPRREIFGLSSQLRRAALSVPSNIVEGYNKKSEKQLCRFLDIALGSLAETKYLVSFAHRLGYFIDNIEVTMCLIDDVGKLLWGFQRSRS